VTATVCSRLSGVIEDVSVDASWRSGIMPSLRVIVTKGTLPRSIHSTIWAAGGGLLSSVMLKNSLKSEVNKQTEASD